MKINLKQWVFKIRWFSWLKIKFKTMRLQNKATPLVVIKLNRKTKSLMLWWALCLVLPCVRAGSVSSGEASRIQIQMALVIFSVFRKSENLSNFVGPQKGRHLGVKNTTFKPLQAISNDLSEIWKNTHS